MKKFQSSSSRETVVLGVELAQELLAQSRKGKAQKTATILALQGDLGAGKTTFTQGFARGLGIKKRPASPTFVIMRRYPVRGAGFKNFYHVDAYRLKKIDALESLGFKEIFSDPKNVVLVEWPEKIKRVLPASAIRIKFSYGKKENERKIIMVG